MIREAFRTYLEEAIGREKALVAFLRLNKVRLLLSDRIHLRDVMFLKENRWHGVNGEGSWRRDLSLL